MKWTTMFTSNGEGSGENTREETSKLTASALASLENETPPADAGRGSNFVPPSPSVAASPYWAVLGGREKESDTGFSPFVAFCFTINYILGTGFLTIPWAFVQGGLILSCIVMIASAIASDICKDYLLETMARAEVMLDDKMHWVKGKLDEDDSDGLLIPPTIVEASGEKESLLKGQEQAPKNYNSTATRREEDIEKLRQPAKSTKSEDGDSPESFQFRTRGMRHTKDSRYRVKKRKFEINVLCRVFLGKAGLRVFTIFVSLYICGCLWAYTSVFASAASRAVPIFGRNDEDFNYLCYAILFGLIVVPLSCLELEEQVKLQVFMTGCRFVMLILMLATSFQVADETETDGTVKDFAPKGMAKTLPILIMANMYHHSIPGLSHPVKDKRKLGSVIFRSTSIFTAFTYSLLGIVLGSAFGDQIEQSANLNWKNFRGGTGYMNEDGEIVDVAWWAHLISFYIILFPALDVLSAFPLNAITLGNNMFGAYFGRRIHEVEHNRCLRTCFRLLASVPPIIFGIFVRELGVITDYTGTTGFVIGLSIPAILYLKSKQRAKHKNYSTGTYYTSYGSHDGTAYTLFWFGISMVIAVFASLTFFGG